MYCDLEWGEFGAARAAKRGDILIIVDTLSFSTSVAVICTRGAIVYAVRENSNQSKIVLPEPVEWAVRRDEVPEKGRYSLSPMTLSAVATGEAIALPSLNGAGCCLAAATAEHVFVGSLVNARAVGEAVGRLARQTDRDISIVACGEIEIKRHEPELRFANEDYIGAGAIIANLPGRKTAEATHCRAAFEAARLSLLSFLHDCQSGQELLSLGFGDDVRLASEINSLDVVPTADVNSNYARITASQ